MKETGSSKNSPIDINRIKDMLNISLENWSYLGTTASAICTLVLVAFAVYQLIALKKQVILSGEAVEAAKISADAAQEAVRETARVRIDEQAPRVIALSEPVQWPPRISRDRRHMPQANDLRMFDVMSLHGSSEAGADDFIFPEQAQWFMWFNSRGVLINEGQSTARVRLEGEGRFIGGRSELLPDVEIACPPVVGQVGASYIGREHMLRPGEVALFEWAYGHCLQEWAQVHETGQPPICEFYIHSFDSTEHGIHDTIKISLQARPLEPVPGRASHWRLRQNPTPALIVFPTIRTYWSEDHRNHPRQEEAPDGI